LIVLSGLIPVAFIIKEIDTKEQKYEEII